MKIISGAMIPTGGSVQVDESQVQLLTLGTGFDRELTARENVYLMVRSWDTAGSLSGEI